MLNPNFEIAADTTSEPSLPTVADMIVPDIHDPVICGPMLPPTNTDDLTASADHLNSTSILTYGRASLEEWRQLNYIAPVVVFLAALVAMIICLALLFVTLEWSDDREGLNGFFSRS